ncbi:MAG TPA: hypothetical protein VD886_11760, partial [Herpetosiphonaceae bacterium]|nr:hypothetical protein [Herpetosiphonaceae bacterium]
MLYSPRWLSRALCLAAGCLLALFGALAPAAAQSPPITVTIDRVGYDLQGHVRHGAWFPAVVTIENQGADARATLAVRTDGNRSIVEQPVDLPGGSRKQITVLLRAHLNQSNVLAQVAVGANRIGADPRRLIVHDPSDAMIGVISDDPGLLAGLRLPGASTTVVNLEPGVFPASDAELANFSALAISSGEPTAEQAALLRRWVVAGGTLLLANGPSSLGLPPELAELAPGTADGAASQVRLTEAITLSARPLSVAPDAEALMLGG